MIRQVIGKKVIELGSADFSAILTGYDEVLVDLGTGDGKFAYKYAQEFPQTFVLGIDSDVKSLEELSHKASRKPAKGGLENVMFIWSAAEELSPILNGVADQVYVNFPWGSLLGGVIKADMQVMHNISQLLNEQGVLKIFTTYDEKYEPQTMLDSGLPAISLQYFEKQLKRDYQGFGLYFHEARLLSSAEKGELTGSWPKRILAQRDRDVYFAEFGKQKIKSSKGASLEYEFTAYGHPNILAEHAKTVEFTKDDELTERGDCILGVGADFDKAELQRFAGRKALLTCQVEDGSGNILTEEFKCKVNPSFDSDHELVLRKSGYNSDRTFGFGLNRGANAVSREFVEAVSVSGKPFRVKISTL